MPVHDFECPACEKVKRDHLHGFEERVACECGREMRKLIGLPHFIWGAGFHPSHESDKAARNLEHPAIVAGLKDGTLEMEKHHDWREGFGSSSSIQVRAAEGSL